MNKFACKFRNRLDRSELIAEKSLVQNPALNKALFFGFYSKITIGTFLFQQCDFRREAVQSIIHGHFKENRKAWNLKVFWSFYKGFLEYGTTIRSYINKKGGDTIRTVKVLCQNVFKNENKIKIEERYTRLWVEIINKKEKMKEIKT